MAFSTKDHSPLRHLVELTATMEPLEVGGIANVHATLQIRSDEIEVGEYTVEVGFSTAYLVVDAEGGSVAAEGKFGMRVTAEFVDDKIITEESQKKGEKLSNTNEVSGEGAINLTNPALKMAGKKARTNDRSNDTSTSTKREVVKRHIPVEAIGSDRWKITEQGGEPLNAHYLTKKQPLCSIVRSAQLSNRFGSTLTLQVKRKDVAAKVVSPTRIAFLTPNKNTILSLLARQHLAGLAQDASPQIITFAASEVYDEG